jgi:hypothetical protein
MDSQFATIMSRCSYFMSALTVRFLRSIEQLRLLPAADRRKLAASIYADIKPHIGTDDYDGLRRAAGKPVIQGVSQQQDKCRSISAT